MITTNTTDVIQVLQANGVVGIPTETVYGLAGSAFSTQAINTIYKIKNRPFENPLIVHIASQDRLTDLVTYVPDELQELMQYFSPGPITFLLPKRPVINDLVTAGKSNVAIRIPSHPITKNLLDKLDFPLVAPSANPFQRISAVTAQQVNAYFENDNLLVLEGGTANCGIESTIVGYENGRVVLYREGFITQSEIEQVIHTTIVNKSEAKEIEAPGMYKKHYAPTCDMIIAKDLDIEIERWHDKKIGLLLLQDHGKNEAITVALSSNGDTRQALSNLYNALHYLEKENVDVIITQLFPEDAYGKIINQRIIKASYK